MGSSLFTSIETNRRIPLVPAAGRARFSLFCLIALCAGCGGENETPQNAPPGPPPAIRTDVPHATADKPQSKLWHAHNRWWAWLPTAAGSRVWQRNDEGWTYDEELARQLTGINGRADVWTDGDNVRAVLVAADRILVIALEWDDARNSYRIAGKPVVWPQEELSSVETATIARDAAGRFWVAFDRELRMWVRRSDDELGLTWSDPFAVSEPAAENDLCTIVALPDAVGLFWSDHVADAFLFRRHSNAADEEWDDVETVVDGPGVADDHLNAAPANDGTLYVATKTGIDEIGQPQLALHVRRPDGRWESHSYGVRTADSERSRPAVFLSNDSRRLHLCHAVYVRRQDGSRSSYIAGISTDDAALNLQQPEKMLIEAALPLNNPTGPKSPLGGKTMLRVLASDAEGNVYDAAFENRK